MELWTEYLDTVPLTESRDAAAYCAVAGAEGDRYRCVMIQTLLVAARDRERFAEVLQVASRFGLGVLLSRLGVADRAADPTYIEPRTLARRTREALEALGPTFVKLGQIMATRSDLLPAQWIAELEELHSRAPTLPFEDLRPAVEAALGEAPEEAFAWFDAEPIAAASMAQVHRATLHNGREVVLKIRRPDVRPRMEADLRLIAQLAGIVETGNAEARRFAPREMVRQLAASLLEELDFTQEGRNADGCVRTSPTSHGWWCLRFTGSIRPSRCW